jgi:hypothetical protein
MDHEARPVSNPAPRGLAAPGHQLRLDPLDARDPRTPADPAGLGDGARRYARDLRLQLWRENLARAEGDDRDLLDPAEALARFRDTAVALERWQMGDQRGDRPPGRVRPHRRVRLSRMTKLWAEPLAGQTVETRATSRACPNPSAGRSGTTDPPPCQP